MKLNTYLHFAGNCEEAIHFYEKVLGAPCTMLLRFGETPEAATLPPEMHDKITHARFLVGQEMLMASDAPPDRSKSPNGFSLHLELKTPEEAERIFHALSENAQITMPMGETYWAHRFGMLRDKFGMPWLINCVKSPGS